MPNSSLTSLLAVSSADSPALIYPETKTSYLSLRYDCLKSAISFNSL